ncbi:MAG: hypothetical protein Q9221_002643 [Calogaya cf. arnoldii]
MYSTDRFSEEKLLEEETRSDEGSVPSLRCRRRSKHLVYLWSFHATFFFANLAILISTLLYKATTPRDDCKDHIPMYSPALDAVRGTGHFQRFDGSFATPNAYKGTPSPNIDAAWANITYENGFYALRPPSRLTLALTAVGGVINISEETLRAVNASREYSVKLAPEIGGGYMASVEALHQLHCLNMLRQATYEDFYKDKAEPWQDSPQTLRYHLDHCIDNLRQKLMCDADAGILTYVWAKGHRMPFPDFSVQHKCRDFDALKNWVVDHQTYTTKDHGIERLSGAQELETPP